MIGRAGAKLPRLLTILSSTPTRSGKSSFASGSIRVFSSKSLVWPITVQVLVASVPEDEVGSSRFPRYKEKA